MSLIFRRTLVAMRLPIGWWVMMMIGATAAGFPAAVCLTPLGWLLALDVGRRYAGAAAMEMPSRAASEAALAGSLVGLLLGAVYLGVVFTAFPIEPHERANFYLLSAGLFGVGLLVCTGLSWAGCWMVMRRTA